MVETTASDLKPIGFNSDKDLEPRETYLDVQGYSSVQKMSGHGTPQTQYSGNPYGSSDSSNTYGQGYTGVGHASHRRDDDDSQPYSSQKK